MLSVNSIMAQEKIMEVWKALNKDTKDNAFKDSVPIINIDEKITRSQINGTLSVQGHTYGAQNSFKYDSKIVWNNCPDEITQNKNIHPPKKVIKMFVKKLPL